MEFISVSELNSDIINNMYKIPRDIDIVVGVPRSGMLPASLIALYLNKALCDLDSFVGGGVYSHGTTKAISALVENMSDVKKALIVEDSSASGTSMKRTKEKLCDIEKNIQCIYMAVYVTKKVEKLVDISCRIVEIPRIFEWNFMHHHILKEACVDIDGVLCIDPSQEENDDGDKYIHFIRNAKPKYIPTARIGWIVTSRLEKYRNDTEKWLRKWGIEYDHLCMLNLKTADERRRLGNHAAFKAEIFGKAKEATWFIESEEEQAKEIARLTGKQVLCTSNLQYEQAAIGYRFSWMLQRKIKQYLIKILPKSLVKKLKKIYRH